MKVGESLIQKIEKAIREMEYLGVILSPDSVESEWVKREVEIAINEEIAGKRVKVLPILVKTCVIPGFLAGKVYADFRRRENWKNALVRVVHALGMDETDVERIAGKRVILVEDFVARIKGYFNPRRVEIEFYDDWSGVNYIKVHNDDTTFELYDFYTRPTYLDLVNKVFGDPRDAPIKDLQIRDGYFISGQEEKKKHDEVRKKYNLPEDSFAGQWHERGENDESFRRAWEEWISWLNGKQVIAFISEP